MGCVALLENFADQNNEDECDLIKVSHRKLWEDLVTDKDGVISVRCAVHTLQQSVHDIFKLISAPKKRGQK